MNNDKIKIIISLPLLLATILSTTTVVLPLLAYAQEEEEVDNGGGNGGDGVTATVNGQSFNKGDAVTISGSVGEEGRGETILYMLEYLTQTLSN